MMAMQENGAPNGRTGRWNASMAIIVLFLLAIGWLIGGFILEKVLGESFFTQFTIIYWVIFFGILVAMFAGMIIGILRDIKWTGEDELPLPQNRILRTISFATQMAVLGAFFGASIGAENGHGGIIFFGIFLGVLFGIFGAIVGFFKNKGD